MKPEANFYSANNPKYNYLDPLNRFCDFVLANTYSDPQPFDWD